MALGYKRMLASSLRTGSIFSLSGEAVLPTGNAARSMGNGVTILETFASFGQLLPKESFSPVSRRIGSAHPYRRRQQGRVLADSAGQDLHRGPGPRAAVVAHG